jgi:hypothetical protein
MKERGECNVLYYYIIFTEKIWKVRVDVRKVKTPQTKEKSKVLMDNIQRDVQTVCGGGEGDRVN